MTLSLRPYQAEAIQKLRLSLAGGKRRLILCSPTGSGKTEMGMEIIRGAQAKGKRVAFLANRVHLVEQTSRRLTKAGILHGVIQAENSRGEYLPVLVASIQTVAKRGLPEVDVMLIDEAHAVAGSKEFRKVVMEAKDTPVVGLSATPWSKGLGRHYEELEGPLFQELITAVTIPELIELGFLVDAEVYAPSEPDLTGVKTVAGDYNETQLGHAVDKPELIGDIVTHWLKLANSMPTVCFATNIAHSKHIVSSFEAVGVKAAHIDCYTTDRERQDILAAVAAGEITIISNVGILTEGWDFPACRVMILARPTKSMIRYIQMAGRVLRPFDGKEHALILDHSGSCKRLGFPTEHVESELDDGRPKDANARKDKEKPLPKACPACHFMKAPKVSLCPACGFKPERQSEVNMTDGELKLLKRTKGTKEQKPWERYGGKQELWSMLLGFCEERGYRPGYAANKYREMCGVWPRSLSDVSKEPSPALRSWLKSQSIRWAKSKQEVANAAA